MLCPSLQQPSAPRSSHAAAWLQHQAKQGEALPVPSSSPPPDRGCSLAAGGGRGCPSSGAGSRARPSTAQGSQRAVPGTGRWAVTCSPHHYCWEIHSRLQLDTEAARHQTSALPPPGAGCPPAPAEGPLALPRGGGGCFAPAAASAEGRRLPNIVTREQPSRFGLRVCLARHTISSISWHVGIQEEQEHGEST